MNELKEFTFNKNNAQIRVQVINDEPWFVTKDVCDALGIEKHRDAMMRLDDDERGSVLVDTLGGRQNTGAVNESGLYNLVFQSRKPEAKIFRKWVTGEVLPSIRRTGGYVTENRMPERRYTKRGEGMNAQTLNLLWLIGEYLVQGDQKDIALELGVSVQSVCNVLNGKQRSNRILTALYNRARKNRDRGLVDFYSRPDQMTDRLLGISNAGMTRERRKLYNGEMPEAWERRRGGQPNNQNARKFN